MYQYDAIDQKIVDQRARQFRDQVSRRFSGDLSEDEFKPLRLMNGLYLQLHAYMLRVAVPYGVLSSRQLRKLGEIAQRYDRGFGHFTTRQNIQFNWIKLSEAPDVLDELASVEMHAIQTSGNTIRNTTADEYAGAVAGEIEDPRVYTEIIRQWSTLHPEFGFLPRKFKVAVTGAAEDRAAVRVHDIGLLMRRDDAGVVGFEVLVGGGLGRTPMIGKTIRDFLPTGDMLSYLEAILRVYNQFGRRDNKYKARIKILVHELGIDEFRRLVDAEWRTIKGGALDLPVEEVDRIRGHFTPPPFETLEDNPAAFAAKRFEDKAFATWVRNNVVAHKQSGYAIVNISLKPTGGVPGDATAQQMTAVADLADQYSFGEVRVTHRQNLVLPHVRQADVHDVWVGLTALGFASPNIGLVGDIIACPGLDYCGLANARSIPISQQISEKFADIARQQNVGDLQIKISGCINACGHHHVGHIGILGVDRRGEEFYQITLGGSADENASIGRIIGPAFSAETVVDAIETIIETYLEIRNQGEPFIDTYRRVGEIPFKERLYATH
ncbi:MAG: nitrite/sulfite reductase [Rhodospirillaceae bacterium]|jgi:sulfite reductase (NADPH) hemoprotein beta-component|nr:nitrite/sulfite reductase [Rhodospirillaceae bacterium]MBT5809494.1 nitrite/sulfite reductase [Rhodospirillaceae bacterium]